MRARTRDRLLLPIVLPLGILLMLALALFGFSRILLSLDHTPATVTALVVALAIIVVAGVGAGRPVIRASSLAAMIGVIAGIAMLAGGAALIAVSPAAGEGGGEGGGPGGAVIEVAASGLRFDTSTIELVADQPATIRFDNQDAGVQHNIAIYEDDSLGKLLFKGDLVTGPDTIEYRVPALPAGTYYFHCDVHPTMNGQVVVAEGGGGEQAGGGAGAGGGGGAGGAGGGGIQPSTVVASGLAFDTDTLSIPGGTPTKLVFDNEDAGTPHNVAIYPSESDLANPLFRGDLVTGPATVTYDIPALDPGSYYFHCDVHPTMKGAVTVT
jgi:plastocyanin